ncbi:unnamed protein product [Staurois parvus]|uniref:Uncharacterized protein n=1 Tax=Staurois parvus TaxID=386267 RepID=A0ABN9HDS1_9NEOB|nr:unnamed protein product [Staurois parvus]
MCANEAAVIGTDRLHLWTLIGGTDEEALVGGTDGHLQASLMGTERQHSYMALIGGTD